MSFPEGRTLVRGGVVHIAVKDNGEPRPCAKCSLSGGVGSSCLANEEADGITSDDDCITAEYHYEVQQ